jgi:hypothetical protein
MARLYVIGDRETGVLFVKTQPLLVTHITKETIESYAASHGVSFDNVFVRLAVGAKALMNKSETNQSVADIDSTYTAIGQLIGKGTTISDAEFCFIADIDDTDWASYRLITPELDSVIADLQTPPSPEQFLNLREARLM